MYLAPDLVCNEKDCHSGMKVNYEVNLKEQKRCRSSALGPSKERTNTQRVWYVVSSAAVKPNHREQKRSRSSVDALCDCLSDLVLIFIMVI